MAYSIGEMAELIGVTKATLRNWEHAGVLNPHREQGQWRRYSEADLQRARYIMQLKREGIGIAAIKRVLELEGKLAGNETSGRPDE